MKKTILALGLLAGLLMAGTSEALLIDRMNGLIYDSTNDISWTKDADLSGQHTWAGQIGFAFVLTLAGFDDFRLATLDELESLYGQLPGTAGSNKTGDISLFEDVQSSYWSNTAVDAVTASFFDFSSGIHANFLKTNNTLYGWAVRPGDSVVAVPEVGSGLLMGLGLMGMRLARRWRVGDSVNRVIR